MSTAQFIAPMININFALVKPTIDTQFSHLTIAAPARAGTDSFKAERANVKT